MAFPWRAEEVEIVGYECHWAFDDGQHIRIAVVYVLEFLIRRTRQTLWSRPCRC